MTRTTVFRRIVGIVAVALTVAIAAGPASARTFDFDSNGSLVQRSTSRSSLAAGPSSFEWGYVAVGASAAGLMLLAAGGILAAGRRRQRPHNAHRARIAA